MGRFDWVFGKYIGMASGFRRYKGYRREGKGSQRTTKEEIVLYRLKLWCLRCRAKGTRRSVCELYRSFSHDYTSRACNLCGNVISTTDFGKYLRLTVQQGQHPNDGVSGLGAMLPTTTEEIIWNLSEWHLRFSRFIGGT